MQRLVREARELVMIYPVGSLVSVLLLGGLVHFVSNFTSACFFVAAGTYWIGGIFTATRYDGFSRVVKNDFRSGFLLFCAIVATVNPFLAIAFLFLFLFLLSRLHKHPTR